MTRPAEARSYLRTGALVTGLLLPTLTLVPLGSIWLWERGLLLYWAIAASLVVGSVYLLWQRLLPPPRQAETGATADRATADPALRSRAEELRDPSWTPAEEQAWSDVLAMADGVDVARLTSQDAVLDLARRTVESVARRLHPEVSEPIWQFTVPEALAILERVSRRLGTFTSENIPLSDRLTVAQALALYRWRGAIDIAEKAYDVWRLVRLVNPVTAATNELRERLSRQMLDWGRTQVTQKLAHAFVTEVGRAAIDLYGGRLRVSRQVLETTISKEAREESDEIAARIAEPLRILIAGQTGAGKSSLVNALAQEVHAAVDALPATPGFAAYSLRREGFPSAHLIDSRGLGATQEDRKALIEKAMDCDLILWVVAAHRADRDIDLQAIAALRREQALRPNRRSAPMLIVMTHIDRLRPVQEWSPPYDVVNAERPKAASIRAAMDAVAADITVPADDIVPVSLGPRTYNVDALWSRIVMVLPEARRAQLVRRLQDARDWSWSRIWSQAAGAGRVLARAVRR
jgi:predicted GTPase